MGTDVVDTSSARAEVLRRIRVAKRGTSDGDAAHGEWKALTREYRRNASRGREAVIELLEDRLRDYDAHVARVTRDDVAAQVASMLEARGKRRMVVPAGIAMEWLPRGFEFVTDEGMTAAELNEVDGVMTGSTVAIAETGTVVLQNVTWAGKARGYAWCRIITCVWCGWRMWWRQWRRRWSGWRLRHR